MSAGLECLADVVERLDTGEAASGGCQLQSSFDLLLKLRAASGLLKRPSNPGCLPGTASPCPVPILCSSADVMCVPEQEITGSSRFQAVDIAVKVPAVAASGQCIAASLCRSPSVLVLCMSADVMFVQDVRQQPKPGTLV